MARSLLRFALLVLGAAPLSGCVAVYHETTLVRVHRPSAVTVSEETPRGPRVLLDGEGTSRSGELTPEFPPFTEEMKYAVVERRPSGAVTLTCPSCAGAAEGSVVDWSGAIVLHGSPGETTAWAPSGLGMRFGYDALFKCRRSHGKCPREALVLDLGTPAENVREIRYRKRVMTEHGERTGAWIAVVVGSVSILGGTSALTALSLAEGRVSTAGLLLGGAFAAVGSAFLLNGIAGLQATSSDRQIFLEPSR